MNACKFCFLMICCYFFITTAESQVLSGEDSLQRIKYQNREEPVYLAAGLWASPLPMDFDADGDLDLIVSCTDAPYQGTYLYENVSGSQDAQTVFFPAKRIGEGIRNISISYIDDVPRLLGPGVEYENFQKKVYNQPVGIFQADQILDHYPKRRTSQWQYVDYENDGDLDLIVGVDDWADYGWDNAFNTKGEWTNGDLHGFIYLLLNEDGTYTNKGKIQAGGADIDVEANTTPNIQDFDGDGDLDIICGEFVDRFMWFENTGSREKPLYAAGKFLKNNDGLIRMDLEMMKPVAVDWNDDGNTDLIVGDEDGRVAYIENTGTVDQHMPVFKSPAYFKQQMDYVKFGGLITPFSVDWDDDGDEDLLCGNTAGYIGFIENLDGGKMPSWSAPEFLKADGKVIRIQAGINGSIQGPAERNWGYTTLSVADWDGDGLKDVIINSIWGKVEWFKNVGEKGTPRLTYVGGVKVDWGKKDVPKPAWNWWTPEKDQLATQWRTTPYAIDWNTDGLMDLVMLDHEGYLVFFERFKKKGDLFLHPGQRIFKDADSEGDGLLRLSNREAGGSGRRKLCFVDWDGDNDLDLLVNSKNVALFENIDSSNGTVTYKNRGDLFERRLAGHTTSPTTVDWNKDGKPDLLVGAEDGQLYYLENN